ncbi:N-acetylglucosamine kinase [Streptomyces spongiae]|uniref:ATPase n=1 Tax=Streptomyces spongiae TaxID=565072 RepID=A0A5N8XYU3_9ACTN|nr:BadF/BadG/BcrA/BcrD ATPase family protein [Streptomyces spongiae]MPY64278.1 ATPase [Streptomyces spongiae]
MNNELNQDLVVGLDAGGTRIRAVLATAGEGRPLGEGVAGPGNALTVPVPQLTEHLAEAVGRAVPEGARDRVVAVAGGFAGATGASPDEPGQLNALAALTAALGGLGIRTEPIALCSDIEAAFASAPGAPADGLALVAGTGAVAARISGRHCAATVDGDGWLLGDDGSGFWIGRGAARAALRMADGRGRPTQLAATVGRALGLPEDCLPYEPEGCLPYEGDGAVPETPYERDGAVPKKPCEKEGAVPKGSQGWSRDRREAFRMHLLPTVMAQPPIRLARLAPLVAEAARRDDAVAGEILDQAAEHLTDTVRALEPRPGERIVATGGLLGPDGPLTEPLTRRLHALGLTLDWVADGCRGAVALARLAHGGRG